MRRHAIVLLAALAACATAQAATLKITDNLTAWHAASEAERKAVIPAALDVVKAEIDKKGKSDAELVDELLPCMNSVDEQVTDDVRATQPIRDLAAVCLAQLGYQKQ